MCDTADASALRVRVSGLSEYNLTTDLGSLGQRDTPELENTRGGERFGLLQLRFTSPRQGRFL